MRMEGKLSKNLPLVWILEDDDDSRFVYAEILDTRFRVEMFSSVAQFVSALPQITSGEREQPTALIADIRLKDGNFVHFLSEHPDSEKLSFPFMIVSSIDDIDILRQCFSEGAVDYLTKPFKAPELVVKLERLHEHYRARQESIGSKVLEGMTQKEAAIYQTLLEARGTLISREELFKKVWQGSVVSSKALDVHLFHLRKKLKVHGDRIEYVNGAGFRLLSNRMDL